MMIQNPVLRMFYLCSFLIILGSCGTHPDVVSQGPTCKSIFKDLSKDERVQKTNSVVTIDHRIQSVDRFPSLLETTVNTTQTQEGPDNLIFFIHGRGKHPGKAFDDELLCDLEHDYSAKVIMFHWPSWKGLTGWPEQSARKAAADLHAVFQAISEFKKRTGDLANLKFTLLTHSMGSLVLEEYVSKFNSNDLTNLFDTLVISASASEAQSHANWATKINLSNLIYITLNRNDGVLKTLEKSIFGLPDLTPRLGKGITADIPVAQNVTYVDVSNTGVKHRYYLHSKQENRRHLTRFLDQALNGQAATLTGSEVRREQIHVLKKG